jgi:deoxyxylulose-5-phosphate synthase
MTRPATPLLDRVTVPADLRNFSTEQLKALAEELRARRSTRSPSPAGIWVPRSAWWS